jgi:5-formyltetrahydrofolate cyclo-ligase
MSQTKDQLRTALKAMRLAMSEQERGDKSATIAEKLRTVVDWSQVSTLHFFEPIAELGEVDVTPLVTELKAQYPQLHIYTSRKKDGDWHVYSIAAEAPIPTISFDVILVPMLGFDATLNRIGFGGGYYDKLLAGQPQAQKIGLCFSNGTVDELPVEPHDVALDQIVTD